MKALVAALVACVGTLTASAAPPPSAGPAAKPPVRISGKAKAPARTAAQVDVIGEEIVLNAVIATPEHRANGGRFRDGLDVPEPEMVFSSELFFAGAEYIAPHFSKFELPAGAYLVVRSADGARSWTYAGEGRALENRANGFWGVHVYGEVAVVELWATRSVPEGAVVIDRFARGFDAQERGLGREQPRALCGADDSLWAKCYQTSEATAYGESRAVARLLINGTSACTGWLVGSEGHVLTNEHCIGTASDAANTTFEFLAEGATCATACNSWGACPGTVVATTSTLVKNDAPLDYALVKLPSNPTGTYGYMQLRSSGATLNERIYIPQHPAAWGKKIAMKAGTANATITSLSTAACSGGPGDLGYSADTQGGSSGSPVLGYSDHLVVGLHHCGSCPNRAVPIQSVISSLGALLPANALGGGPTTYSISGNAGTSGATVTTGSASASSDASGNYTIAGLAAGTYTVSPSKAGCTFSPASQSVTVGPSATGRNFTASCGTGGSQLLGNPGFESGNVTWTATAGVVTSSASKPARTGSWKAWLGGNGTTATETLYQQVTIPSTAASATLSFWLRVDTAETTTTTVYDTLRVQIRNSANTVLATLATYSNLNPNATYAQKSFDLSSYRGQTIRVYFLMSEDSSLQTSFVVDDTALAVP